MLGRRRPAASSAGAAPEVRPALDLAAVRAAYARDGYALLPGVFSLPEIAALREATDWVERHPGVERETAPNGATRIAFWPSRVSVALDQARTDARLGQIASAILETGDLRSGTSQVYYRSPGDPDSFQWHRDAIFRDAMDDPARYVQAAIFLDDVTAVDQGAILFVPGSHATGAVDGLWTLADVAHRKGGSWPLDDRYGPFRPALVTAGSVGLWHPLVIHGSQPNVTDRSRRYVMVGYADAAVVGDAYPWAFREGKGVAHA